jgi:hypothetical protein
MTNLKIKAFKKIMKRIILKFTPKDIFNHARMSPKYLNVIC